MEKILAIIQARMGSIRLANKMILEICGKTVLEHVISRIKKSKKINDIVVATSVKEKDNLIEEISKRENVNVYRGSEENVLQRFKEAADEFNGDILIRICADSPLIDPDIIDKAIIKFLEIRPDYLTTTMKRTFPEGLDVEVFSKEALNKVYCLAKDKEDLEHVTFYIRKHQDLFNCYNLESPDEFMYPEIKLTLDTQNDFLFIKSIFEFLYPSKEFFSTRDLLKFLNNKYKAIFRVDGSSKLGMGDVFSMLNLAEELKYFNILFIVKYDMAVNKLKEFGYNVEKIPENISLEEEFEIIKEINDKFKADIIITELFKENYQEYYERLSKISKTLIIDLFGDIEVYADILLNWDLLVEDPRYIKKNKNTIYCVGPEYTLLKGKIGKCYNMNKLIKNKVENVLITMGGADPRNLTPRIINALSDFNDIKFNVVIGPAFTNRNEINETLENSDLNYSLVENMNDLSEIMYDSDLVICAGGLTSFELCAIGTPFIGISNIGWEDNRLRRMEEKGICKYSGGLEEFDEKRLHNIFKDLINNKKERENMSLNGKKLLDGKGANKTAKIIMGIIINGNKTNN